jgi:hypothetical protein
VTVPPNAGAHCTFLGVAPSAVTEGGHPVAEAADVKVVGTTGGVTLAVGAGTYVFTAAK